MTRLSKSVESIVGKSPHWFIRWGSSLFLIVIMLVLVVLNGIQYPEIISSHAIIGWDKYRQEYFAKLIGHPQRIEELQAEQRLQITFLRNKNKEFGIEQEYTSTYVTNQGGSLVIYFQVQDSIAHLSVNELSFQEDMVHQIKISMGKKNLIRHLFD